MENLTRDHSEKNIELLDYNRKELIILMHTNLYEEQIRQVNILLSNLNLMDEDELTLFFSDFPYYEMFNVFKRNLSFEGSFKFLKLISYYITDNFNSEEFMNDNDLNILISFLNNSFTADDSFQILYYICVTSEEYCLILCTQYQILTKLNFVTNSLRNKIILYLCTFRHEINIYPYIYDLIHSTEEIDLIFGIKCVMFLKINENFEMFFNLIVENLMIIYENIQETETKVNLFNLLSLSNHLSNDINIFLMNILQNNNEIIVFKSILNIFIVNSENWKGNINNFEICKIIIIMLERNLTYDIKVLFLKSILIFYDFIKWKNEKIFQLLIDFLDDKTFTFRCIKCIEIMLANGKEYLNTYSQYFYELQNIIYELMTEVECDENTFEIFQIVLSYIE